MKLDWNKLVGFCVAAALGAWALHKGNLSEATPLLTYLLGWLQASPLGTAKSDG